MGGRKRGLAIMCCAAGALACAATPALAGRAWSTLGDVTAELRWGGTRAQPSPVTLVVTRGDAVTRLRPAGRTAIPDGRPVVVRDLDGDGEPEAVADLAGRGATAGTRSVIARWSASDGGYASTEQDWGAPGYRLRDLNRDGRPEFVATDLRLAGLPSVPRAAAARPIRIWAYRAGELRDVTASHRAAVRADMRMQLSVIDAAGSSGRAPLGAVAAYVADARVLGAGDAALARMRARFPGSERLFTALAARLDRIHAATTQEGARP